MSKLLTSKATMFATASCLLVAYAFAQPGQTERQTQSQYQPSTAQTQRTMQQGTSQQSGRNINPEVEQYLASCLLTKNQAEIELSQLATQRAQNPQVKQYAEKLIADHQAAVQKLRPVAGTMMASIQDRTVQPAGFSAQDNAAGQPGTTDRSDANRANDRNRAENPNSPLHQLAAIEKQIAERCQQELREKLQSKQGAEFDQCFVGAQIAGHMQMLAALEVIQNQTSGQLSEIAKECEPKIKQHLATAEQLGEQLMASNSRRSDSVPTTQIPR